MPCRSFSIETISQRACPKPDWELTSEEVEQGCILWLGTIEDTVESAVRRGQRQFPVVNVHTAAKANGGMFNHPILILSRPAHDPTSIDFLPMTSLNGQSLLERFRGRKSTFHQNTFVPLLPAPDHPQRVKCSNSSYRTLTFENGDRLEKPTYVNVRELYRMNWNDAELYWGSDATVRKKWKVDVLSMDRLMRLAIQNAGYVPVKQHREPGSATWPQCAEAFTTLLPRPILNSPRGCAPLPFDSVVPESGPREAAYNHPQPSDPSHPRIPPPSSEQWPSLVRPSSTPGEPARLKRIDSGIDSSWAWPRHSPSSNGKPPNQ